MKYLPIFKVRYSIADSNLKTVYQGTRFVFAKDAEEAKAMVKDWARAKIGGPIHSDRYRATPDPIDE